MTKGKLPSLPFKRIKEKIVGKDHEVSLVFISNSCSQTLNRERRSKDAPANILTFALSETLGEIFISPREAKKDATKFERTYREFLADLFIHGLFHLKGDAHGSRMKTHEADVRKKFHLE
ncbi:MAG: Endoribonuclease YbeY [Parcubacteria group bacterium Gr01-1014_48]|nr:MAG: Endoribonuclease YbeY [Parcubacteria group bacterium Gr01-1014_48]